MTPLTRYLIGIDCGSTMVKAAVFDIEGREHATASKKIEHIYLYPDWTENNMDTLWNNVCEVIREVIHRSNIHPKEIVSVTCTGHGNGLYLVDGEGNPVRNGIISSDNRARKYIEEWTRNNILEQIMPKTMQNIWAAQPNALLRWLIDNEPETISSARYLFMVKDFIRYRLTGEAYMELTDMSGTSLINNSTADYDDEVLDVWGLADWRHLMPPLKRSADICGTITSEAAKQTGLAEGTPVAGGMFDIDACGLAVGMTDETRFCMVAGTWGNNLSISKIPVIDKEMFMTSCYSIDGYYLMLEGSAISAGNLEWFVSHFFQSDKELLQLRGAKENIYDYCSHLVAETLPENSGVVFLPFLYGNPIHLDAKACIFGLDGRYSRSHVMRAVFEGICFGHRWHSERLFRFRGRPQTIRLTGGAVNSPVWAQMFSDIFQLPIEIPTGTELGCFGAALCGAVAVGIYKTYHEACEKMVTINRRFDPNPKFAEIYEIKYQRYLKLLDALLPVWDDLKTTGFSTGKSTI